MKHFKVKFVFDTFNEVVEVDAPSQNTLIDQLFGAQGLREGRVFSFELFLQLEKGLGL